MKNYTIIGTLLILLTGCTKQKIKLEKKLYTIEHLNKYSADFIEEKNNIFVAVKQLGPDDSSYLFNCNINRCGIQPIQITVRNLSAQGVLFNPASLGLVLIAPKRVAQRCHWKTKEIVGAGGILAAIFLWPLLIPISYGGYTMYRQNRKISKAIVTYNMLQNWDMIKIRPLETISKIVFIDKEYIPSFFMINLFSQETKEALEFKVKLAE